MLIICVCVCVCVIVVSFLYLKIMKQHTYKNVLSVKSLLNDGNSILGKFLLEHYFYFFLLGIWPQHLHRVYIYHS